MGFDILVGHSLQKIFNASLDEMAQWTYTFNTENFEGVVYFAFDFQERYPITHKCE
jgi:hypothetical protein